LELNKNQFYKAAVVFKDMEHHLSIKGVIQGVIPGRVFLSGDGSSSVVVNPQGILLGGNPDNKEFFAELNKKLKDDILPGALSRGRLDYVVFFPQTGNWKHALDFLLHELYPMPSGRMTLSHNMDNVASGLEQNIYPVDKAFLERKDLAGLDGVLEEISSGWASVEEFTSRGFGCAAVQDTGECPAVISWCLTDWVVGDQCEIGIWTDSRFRRQGWGNKTANGTLFLAKQKGIRRVGWQCWKSNVASQKVAYSAGFKLLKEFPVFFGWTHPLSNFLVNGIQYMNGKPEYGVARDYGRAAWFFTQALEKGWDWKGQAYLYWNAACMLYKTGDTEQAKRYYGLAVQKGWNGIRHISNRDHLYSEPDCEYIERTLSNSLQ
jgi:RimJ/RimL family protein N-acetyltransferase